MEGLDLQSKLVAMMKEDYSSVMASNSCLSSLNKWNNTITMILFMGGFTSSRDLTQFIFAITHPAHSTLPIPTACGHNICA